MGIVVSISEIFKKLYSNVSIEPTNRLLKTYIYGRNYHIHMKIKVKLTDFFATRCLYHRKI